jgi:hypothetical protein
MTFDALCDGVQPIRAAVAPGPTWPYRQINQTVICDLALELGDVILHILVYVSEMNEHDRPLLPGQ